LRQLSLNTGKSAFNRHEFVDDFIGVQRGKTQHRSHSVALLVLNSPADMVGTVLPSSAIKNDANHVRVPPQLRMTSDKLLTVFPWWEQSSDITVHGVATVMAREILNLRIKGDRFDMYCDGHKAMVRNQLLYLGTTLGNGHHAGKCNTYSKYYHWVGIRTDRQKDVFRNDSTVYTDPAWLSPNHMLSLDVSLAMSARKQVMMQDAIWAYAQITGEHNKLAQAVHERKQAA
jgi:hypothetical protein